MTSEQFHSKDVLINEDLDFSSLVQHPVLLKGLVDAGYQKPSPIQLKTIPLGRLGLDLIAQAKSGTGKTIVFSVIAIEIILSGLSADSTTKSDRDPNASAVQHQRQQQHNPKAVIIAPTREIAVQIQDVIRSLLKTGLEHTVTCHSMIGGTPIQQDKENLKRCSIVVGTPGRVRSLISTGHLVTNQVRLLVLDEADKLMEDVFKQDVFNIAERLGANKQVMAFSATYDDDLLKLLDQLVKSPVYVMLSNGTPELEGVLQYYKVATVDDKDSGGSIYLKQLRILDAKFAELEHLLTHVPFYQGIVFLNHRGRAQDLVKVLTRKGWPAMHIASGIPQEERLEVMKKARKFELRILVCSDLIARGIDIDRVNLVVNLDLPRDPETYLHRIGRTGRYGTTGLAVSIVDEQELNTVEILKSDYRITIQQLPLEPSDAYKELSRSINIRHRTKPLQKPEDIDQFKKLEAERILGEQRAQSAIKMTEVYEKGDKDNRFQRHCPPLNSKRKSPNEVLKNTGDQYLDSAEQRLPNKKSKSPAHNKPLLLTPEMSPLVANFDTINTQASVSHPVEGEEIVGSDSDKGEDSKEEDKEEDEGKEGGEVDRDDVANEELFTLHLPMPGYASVYPNVAPTMNFPSLIPLILMGHMFHQQIFCIIYGRLHALQEDIFHLTCFYFQPNFHLLVTSDSTGFQKIK
ncbi:DEAD (Asp-Glu-Ala-Asp) box polypeptide 20 [Lobosporangium transversale]|nr:DEAD (Asp-Glu-Ala-Asp) box polypeptide 20 [Lobosporangium transversale]